MKPSIPEPRHHLLIAGTGRTGTSVLLQLLSECGLDTVFSRNSSLRLHPHANAGAESNPLSNGDHPYVVKSPWAYQYIKQLLGNPNIKIDEILIPIRNLSDATASRIILEMSAHRRQQAELQDLEDPWSDWGETPGGVVYSIEPLDQARILAHSLHRLIEHAEMRDVPYRFLSFPRFLQDPAYLYRRINHLLPSGLDFEQFQYIVARVFDPEAVRVERELEEMLAVQARMPSPETSSLPSLQSLDRISILREINDLSKRLKALEAKVEKAGQAVVPSQRVTADKAPAGFSSGDDVLTKNGLAGWHWLTLPRQDNTTHAVQLAFSDTMQTVLYRIKTDNVWSLWMSVELSVPT